MEDTQNSGGEELEFKYIIGEKDGVLVVLFVGKMSSKAVPVLDTCLAEIKAKHQPVVIFSFRDVTNVQAGMHAPFAQLQKQLRDEGKVIGVCSIKPDLKFAMDVAGIIRTSEVFNNIPEAWRKLAERVLVANGIKKAA